MKELCVVSIKTSEAIDWRALKQSVEGTTVDNAAPSANELTCITGKKP